MILTIILIAIAAACWALMSWQMFYSKDGTGFWDRQSWKRKYKIGRLSPFEKAPPNTWYYSINKLKYRERFFGSATFLVFLTDGYHLMQWIAIKCICIAAASSVKEFFILYGVWLLIFNVVFTKMKK